MRLLVNSLIYDTDCSERIGCIQVGNGAHRQLLYRTQKNRYFFVFEEHDVNPIFRRLIPVSATTAAIWKKQNHAALNYTPKKKKTVLTTTFLSGSEDDYSLPSPIEGCLAIPLKK